MKPIDNEAEVKMVQVSRHRWEIQTQHGYVLKADITVSNPMEAEMFVKNYISSYLAWSYVVQPIKPKDH